MLPPGSRSSKIKPPRKSLTNSSISSNNQPFDYNKSWEVLANAIIQIQNKNVSNLSYEQLYRKAYTLVLHKFGNKLYENVANLIKDHMLNRRLNLLSLFAEESQGSGLGEEIFLKSVLVEWDEHLQSMKFVSDVLMYLNRVYIKEQNKLLIYDLGIQLFKDYVIKYKDNEVGNKIIDILIHEIEKNRNGQVISTKIYITKIISMFELLHEDNGLNDMSVVENYFQKYFEPVFLSNSENFFQNLIHRYLDYSSGLKYLTETNQFLNDEIDRINFYLPDTTIPKLIELMNNILIKSQLDHIINLPKEGLQFYIQPIKSNIISNQINSTLNDDQLTYLKLLYHLNFRIDNNCELLKIRLKELIVKEGKEFPLLIKDYFSSNDQKEMGGSRKSSSSLNSPAFANKWIDSILSYKEQFSKIVKQAFNHDYSMEQFITNAIQEFVNLSSRNKRLQIEPNLLIVNPAELLSVYMDSNIKQFLKPNSPTSSKDKNFSSDSSLNSLEEFTNKSIKFLRFIIDKDAFEVYYKNHFAKRFLNAKGFNLVGNLGVDIEELIISKLSEELGTTSLDSIIKMNLDIKSSRDITSEWKSILVERKDSSVIDMDLKICNVSYWPNSMTKDYKKLSGKDFDESSQFIWPRNVKYSIYQFEQFWAVDKKNENKSLYWCPKFGSMDLKISYPSKTYEISLSTYAGVIMLLFGPNHSLDSDNDMASKTYNPFKDKKKLTYTEIKELTGIPEMDLKRHLQSIAVAPKLRLLVKAPMTKEVNDTDVFELNDKFKSPSMKVKVLTVSASSSNAASSNKLKKSTNDEELEEIEANISESRKHEINAAIVRILKSRQQIGHSDLVTEILRQLQNRFLPNNAIIKRQLEDLIEKEYLKRDDENRNLYHYIA